MYQSQESYHIAAVAKDSQAARVVMSPQTVCEIWLRQVNVTAQLLLCLL